MPAKLSTRKKERAELNRKGGNRKWQRKAEMTDA